MDVIGLLVLTPRYSITIIYSFYRKSSLSIELYGSKSVLLCNSLNLAFKIYTNG